MIGLLLLAAGFSFAILCGLLLVLVAVGYVRSGVETGRAWLAQKGSKP